MKRASTDGPRAALRARVRGRKHDPVPRLRVDCAGAPVRYEGVAAMSDEAKPYPKSSQLARGERRYRRKVASAKQWQRIIQAKQGPCRVCRDVLTNGRVQASIEFHHLVKRGAPFFGDDTEENIVPLCHDCHSLVTLRNPLALEVLAARLLDSEYAYIIDKLGDSGIEHLFGVGRS